MDDDISVEDLLAAVFYKQPKAKSTPQGYQPVQYVENPAVIYCIGCNTEYHGIITSVLGMENIYDGYKTKWCPRCIASQEQIWFEHCFRMKNITSNPFINQTEGGRSGQD